MRREGRGGRGKCLKAPPISFICFSRVRASALAAAAPTAGGGGKLYGRAPANSPKSV